MVPKRSCASTRVDTEDGACGAPPSACRHGSTADVTSMRTSTTTGTGTTWRMQPGCGAGCRRTPRDRAGIPAVADELHDAFRGIVDQLIEIEQRLEDAQPALDERERVESYRW